MRRPNHPDSVPYATKQGVADVIKLLVGWDIVFGIGFAVLAYFNHWGTWAVLFGLAWAVVVALGGLTYARYVALQDEAAGESDPPDQARSLFR